MEKDYIAVLEKWKYDPPYNIMWGFVHNDKYKRWPDHVWIHTSSLIPRGDHDFKNGDIIQTRNNRYLLGTKGSNDAYLNS